MYITTIAAFIGLLIWLAVLAAVIALVVLIIKALLKYLRSKDTRTEQAELKRSLGEVLKSHRTRCKMTQEFVAEALGVSRQAVSKWENGTSDPSTANLLALAKLYGVSPEELLRQVDAQKQEG
ncbi:MAG: helix-turn-helix domain-containing protein [Oscillospiraceae bacterium]|nr:helix-turn-helix domain-containing protein [Oscillospiraceae bacterium]